MSLALRADAKFYRGLTGPQLSTYCRVETARALRRARRIKHMPNKAEGEI